MIDFFKNLFSKDKDPKRDVIVLEGVASEEENEEKKEACAPRGCGGCGCH